MKGLEIPVCVCVCIRGSIAPPIMQGQVSMLGKEIGMLNFGKTPKSVPTQILLNRIFAKQGSVKAPGMEFSPVSLQKDVPQGFFFKKLCLSLVHLGSEMKNCLIRRLITGLDYQHVGDGTFEKPLGRLMSLKS